MPPFISTIGGHQGTSRRLTPASIRIYIRFVKRTAEGHTAGFVSYPAKMIDTKEAAEKRPGDSQCDAPGIRAIGRASLDGLAGDGGWLAAREQPAGGCGGEGGNGSRPRLLRKAGPRRSVRDADNTYLQALLSPWLRK